MQIKCLLGSGRWLLQPVGFYLWFLIFVCTLVWSQVVYGFFCSSATRACVSASMCVCVGAQVASLTTKTQLAVVLLMVPVANSIIQASMGPSHYTLPYGHTHVIKTQWPQTVRTPCSHFPTTHTRTRYTQSFQIKMQSCCCCCLIAARDFGSSQEVVRGGAKKKEHWMKGRRQTGLGWEAQLVNKEEVLYRGIMIG